MLIAVRDININVEEKGSGDALVFLHGVGGSAADWSAQLTEFSSDYRAIAIDLRGAGGSDVTRTDLELQDYADDIVTVLDELGVERAVLVGLSFGGAVALQLAETSPQKLRALVVADSTSFLPAEMAAQMAQTKALAVQFGMAANFEQVRPVIFASAALAADAAYIRDYSERFAAGDPEGFGISMAALSRIAVQGGLGQITLPTLVIVGDEDHLLPLPNSEAIAAGIPGARLEVIAGASHLSNLDKPDEFNALVRGFLDGLDQN